MAQFLGYAGSKAIIWVELFIGIGSHLEAFYGRSLCELGYWEHNVRGAGRSGC